MKNLADVIAGILFLAICGIGAWSISSLPEASDLDHFGPASFPTILLVALAICSIVLIIKGIRFAPAQSYLPEKKIRKPLFLFIMLFYAYLLVITYLGDYFLNVEKPIFVSGGAYNIATFSFLMLALPILGRHKIIQNVIVSVITTASLYSVFGIFFQILLP